MNIVVCVKHVPDAQSERTFRESDSTIDREGVDGLLSELDEYAVEQALQVVEKAGEGEITYNDKYKPVKTAAKPAAPAAKAAPASPSAPAPAAPAATAPAGAAPT